MPTIRFAGQSIECPHGANLRVVLLRARLPLYSRVELGLGPEHMGALMGISGFGSFVGALGLLSIPKGHRAGFLKGGAAAVCIGLAGLAQLHERL